MVYHVTVLLQSIMALSQSAKKLYSFGLWRLVSPVLYLRPASEWRELERPISDLEFRAPQSVCVCAAAAPYKAKSLHRARPIQSERGAFVCKGAVCLCVCVCVCLSYRQTEGWMPTTTAAARHLLRWSWLIGLSQPWPSAGPKPVPMTETPPEMLVGWLSPPPLPLHSLSLPFSPSLPPPHLLKTLFSYSFFLVTASQINNAERNVKVSMGQF